MKIRAKDDKKIPLIFSTDKPYLRQGLVFSFHPKHVTEAAMLVRGLYIRLAHLYREDNIKCFFDMNAVLEGKTMKYNPETQTVTCDADNMLKQLLDADKDMAFEEEIQEEGKDADFGKRAMEFVGERKLDGNDGSVSTFGTQTLAQPPPSSKTPSKTPIPEVNIAPTSAGSTKSNEESTTSTTSSLSKGTIQSMNSRIAKMEQSVTSQLADFGKNMQSLLLAMQDLKAQHPSNTHNTHNPGPPVTPTSAVKSTTLSRPDSLAGSSEECISPGPDDGGPGNG